MTTETLPKRILWAVDALATDKALQDKTVKILRAWAKGSGAVIEPVFILSPDQLYVPPDMLSTLATDLKETAKKNLDAIAKRAKLPGLLAPTLLAADNFSLRNAVDHLVAYARQTGAELIVVSSSSKKGATRFLFGSFAETLILHSEIPVFLVTPKTIATSTFKHIFFPTDLSERSRDVFRTVTALAKAHRSKITLFHKIEYLNQYTLATLESTPLYQGYMKDDIIRRRHLIEAMAEDARAHGVKTDVVLDKKLDTVSESIFRAARRAKADLIAMASQTGPVVTALLGSVTRQTLRAAPCPVWVVHPMDTRERSTVRPSGAKRALATVAIVLLTLSASALGADTPKSWPAKMKKLAGVMSELLPELAAKKSDPKVLEKNAKALTELSHNLDKAMKKPETAPPADADPSIALIAERFSAEAQHAYRAIHRGQIEYGKNVLRTVTAYCIACHTRHDRGPDFPTFPLDAKTKKLDRSERADLLAATRQFDKALDEYRAIVEDDASAKKQQLDWERAVRHALSIAVRVKKDPKAADEIVTRVLVLPSAPEFVKKNAAQWKESIAKWKAEAQPKVNTEEGAFAETMRLLAEARAAQKYPADRSADILYLRTSAAAHELLRVAPNGAHASEALLVAGTAYEVLNDPILWPVHEMYFDACIRKAPHTAIAQECYQRYEETIFVGYSGSGGTFIPDEVQAVMSELKALARPEKEASK